MPNCKRIILALFLYFINACNVFTDFSEQKEKLVLSKLTEEKIYVTLEEPLGTLQIVFKEKLEPGAIEEFNNLFGNDIVFEIVDNEKNESVLTTENFASEPLKPGDFIIFLSEDRKTINLIFFNETDEDQIIKEEGEYTGILKIKNNDYFLKEEVIFDLITD